MSLALENYLASCNLLATLLDFGRWNYQRSKVKWYKQVGDQVLVKWLQELNCFFKCVIKSRLELTGSTARIMSFLTLSLNSIAPHTVLSSSIHALRRNIPSSCSVKSFTVSFFLSSDMLQSWHVWLYGSLLQWCFPWFNVSFDIPPLSLPQR